MGFDSGWGGDLGRGFLGWTVVRTSRQHPEMENLDLSACPDAAQDGKKELGELDSCQQSPIKNGAGLYMASIPTQFQIRVFA